MVTAASAAWRTNICQIETANWPARTAGIIGIDCGAIVVFIGAAILRRRMKTQSLAAR